MEDRVLIGAPNQSIKLSAQLWWQIFSALFVSEANQCIMDERKVAWVSALADIAVEAYEKRWTI